MSQSDIVLSPVLLASFSLALVDLASHWLSNPWARYSWVVLSLGLAGYAGLRRHSGLSGALRGWGALMLAAPIVQACAIAFALLALSSGASQLALFLLDTLTWIAIALPTIVLTERAVMREGERAS
jgi:hypothetical protein